MVLNAFLSKHTAADLPLPKEVASIDVSATAGMGFQVLMEHHILSVPVVEGGQGIGLIDMADYVSYIVGLLPTVKPSDDIMTQLNQKLSDTPIKDIMNFSQTNPWHPVSVHSTVLSLVQQLGNGIRRIPLIDSKTGKVENIVTQSTVLKFLHAHIDAMNHVGKQTAAELGFTHGVVSVPEDTPALEAFRIMSTKKIGSVAIVDDAGSLVTTISLSDIKGVAYEATMAVLYQPALSFAAAVRQRSTREMSPSISVRQNVPLETIIAKLSATRVHRLYIVDEEHVPIGVVSLTDICRACLTDTE